MPGKQRAEANTVDLATTPAKRQKKGEMVTMLSLSSNPMRSNDMLTVAAACRGAEDADSAVTPAKQQKGETVIMLFTFIHPT